jgi:hypothetical protein
MIFLHTRIQKTPAIGWGLFAHEFAPKGSVVGILTLGANIMRCNEYQEAQRQNNDLIRRTGARWVDDYFLYGCEIGPDEYLNHSFRPSLLYHCGICFAMRDIFPGDELTVNYQYLLATEDATAFVDHETGRLVDGLPAREALCASGRELLLLLSSF